MGTGNHIDSPGRPVIGRPPFTPGNDWTSDGVAARCSITTVAAAGPVQGKDDDGFGYSCRVTVIGRLLFLGPILVLFAWFAAGQWDLAEPETRAWLQFTGVVCLASLTPLPGTSWSPSGLRARVRWWGWVVVVGLLVAS